MANRLFCGEKSTLTILLGNKTLWGKRYFVEVDEDNSAGDIFAVLEVLIDFAGDKKTVSTTISPWLLAEDNPVISW